jgi:hypothetical protein
MTGRLLQLLLVLHVTLLALIHTHAFHRGFDSALSRGRIRRRFLQMNNNNNNNDPGSNNNDPGNNNNDKPGDNPGNNPGDGGNPVPPAPTTAAPVISVPKTDAPVSSAPVTLAPVDDTPSPSVPTSSEPTKAKAPETDPTASPTKSSTPGATSSAVDVVDLLAFVVVQDGGNVDDLTSTLEALLATQIGKEFDSLTAVQLNLQAQKISGRALLDELVYSGTATFDSKVSAQDVQQTQTQVLEDSETVQLVAPTVSSITVTDQTGILAPSAAPDPSSGGSSGASSALIAGIVVAVVLALAAALFFGYRYYKSPPAPPPLLKRNDENGNVTSTKARKARKSNQESSAPKEMPPPDNSNRSGKSYGHNPELDDYSLDAFSLTDSEAGMDKTQLYLAQRYKQKQRQHQNLANDDQSCDASDADFSYDLVGKKGMESDDDVYTSEVEPSSIEVGIDGNAAYMTGYFGHLGGPRNDSRKLITPPRVQRPSNDIPNTRPRNDIPFDEPEERPFDEATPVKVTPPAAASTTATSAKQVQYGAGDDSGAEDYPIGRNRSNNSRQSLEDEKEDLSSFLRGRRKAKRAARKNRETRKQPPIAMEV